MHQAADSRNADPAAGCFGVAQQRPGARKRLAVFKPRDGGLAGAHRKFGLRQACAQTSGAVRRLP
jgi:hypothetical protein